MIDCDQCVIGTIGELKPGQSGFIVAWAFSTYDTVYARRGGTLSVEVGRNADGKWWTSVDDLASVIRTLNQEAP